MTDIGSATGAVGRSAMLLYTGDTQPVAGSFDDRFVVPPDGWRFAGRRGSLTVRA